jgi:hypothetical protein
MVFPLFLLLPLIFPFWTTGMTVDKTYPGNSQKLDAAILSVLEFCTHN